MVGGREQQRIGRNSWGPIRDDWRRAASLVLALQIWPVASRNRKVALVAVPPGLLLKTFSSTLWDYSSSRVFTESHRVIVTVTVAEWEIVPLLAVIATV